MTTTIATIETAWRALHLRHLNTAARVQSAGVRSDFPREPFNHPGWYWLVCPCGAKYLCAEPGADGAR